MNRRHYPLTVVLSLVAGFAGHALYGSLATPPAAQAAAEPRRESQWEYAVVIKSPTPSVRSIYWILYLKGDGGRSEPVEAPAGGNSQAKAIAKLGEEGWEIVGEGPFEARPDPRPGAPAPTAIYFKRRRD